MWEQWWRRLLVWGKHGVSESRLLGGEGYASLNARFAEGEFSSRSGEAGRAFFRRICLRARDRSLIFAWVRAFGSFLLRGSLRAYGSFLLLSTAFCLLMQAAIGRLSLTRLSFPILIALAAASILLLNSRCSLSHAIDRSALCRWLLFSTCARPIDTLVFGAECGRDRPWLTLLLAVLLGGVMGATDPLLWILLMLTLLIAVPELGFLILLLALPFLNLIAHATAALALAVVIALSLWMCKLLCGHRESRRDILGFFIFLFGASLLLGGVFSAGGMASARRGAILFFLLLSYFPMRDLLGKSQWRGRALFLLSLSLLVVSLMGIAQYVLGLAELNWVDLSRFSDIGGRVTAVFGNPNVLAVYLLLTYPVALGVALDWERPLGGRVVYGLATLSALICLVLTWSRGAWLGAILSLLLFLLTNSGWSRRLLILVAIPACIWAPLLPHSIVNRFSSITHLAEGSIRYRLHTWWGTLRMIAEHPFGVGVGEEAWTSVYRRFAVSGAETVPHAHNLLLQILSELGVMGLLCFLVVLILLARRSWEGLSHRSRGSGSGAALGAACALVGTLVMGVFDNVWYHYGLFWLFWVVVAAVDGILFSSREEMAEGGLE